MLEMQLKYNIFDPFYFFLLLMLLPCNQEIFTWPTFLTEITRNFYFTLSNFFSKIRNYRFLSKKLPVVLHEIKKVKIWIKFLLQYIWLQSCNNNEIKSSEKSNCNIFNYLNIWKENQKSPCLVHL